VRAPALTNSSGGSTFADTSPERLIRDAHTILANCGVTMNPQRVTRLVRTFKRRVEFNGWDFFHFLATAIQLNDTDRRKAMANPEVARVIAYADPTGETAVAHVMREVS